MGGTKIGEEPGGRVAALPSPSLLLFDLDGTLIDSLGSITTALNSAFGRMGLPPVDRAAVALCMGEGDQKLISSLLPNRRTEVVEGATSLFREAYLGQAEAPLYPGVLAVLRHCKRGGRKIAVVTNKPVALAERSLQTAGIGDLVDMLAADDGTLRLKPAPDLIVWVLKGLSVAPGEALMIGDSDVDILAGKAAGVRTCGVTGGIGCSSGVVHAQPDWIIDSLIGLLSLCP